MKTRSIAAIILTTLFALPALANECEQTCDQEYNECKDVAESATAKQACEDDVKACKAECK